MTIEWIRHGDVALVRVLQLPHGKTKTKRDDLVLAEGELTGHVHTLELSEPVTVVEDWWGNIEGFILTKPAQLTHQEHATVEIPEGMWLVKRQREFWGQSERQVMD